MKQKHRWVLATLGGFTFVSAAASSAQIAAKADLHGLSSSLTLSGILARVWQPVKPSQSPHLVVVLHGDLAGPGDAYQYEFAGRVRDSLADTVVIAMLRPGYSDGSGGRSQGSRGRATGDNYTPEVLQELNAAIGAAKARYRPKDITIVGHSGGAVLAADLAEVAPELFARLLLVSCPCDVPKWRTHMALHQANPAWLLPVRSRSPQEGIRSLRPALRLTMLVGEKDAVAPPEFTLNFAAAARAIGIRPTVRLLPSVGHNILLDQRVMDELISLQASP